MLIRHAVSSDTEAIMELIDELGYKINRESVTANLHMYERVQGYVFVVEEGGKVIAFFSGVFIPLFHAAEIMFRITALCVHHSKRAMGVGKSMLQKAEELCKKKDCYYLEVTSGQKRNKEAHVFYESLGYESYKGKRFIKRLEKKG